MRKGQSALEFVALTGAMFFFFGVTVIYVQQVLLDYTDTGQQPGLLSV